MGSLSSYITPTVRAAGGIEQGKLQGLVEKIKADKEAKAAAQLAAVQGATIKHLGAETANLENPKPTYDSDRGVMVNPKDATSMPVAGIEPKPHAPLPGSPEDLATTKAKAIIQAKYGYHAPDQMLLPVQQDGGAVVYTPRGQAAGQRVPSKTGQGSLNLAAPLAAKVGQFGEMLKKASDLMPATDALNVSLGNSAAQDVATHGIGAFGAHIPGTQGLGSLAVNKSPEYSVYQAALSPFILAAAHALSGARINDTQVQQIRASIEIKPGDSPKVRTQKHKNVIDLINSIGGSLPSDAIGAQEDQMDPTAMTMLKGYGYKNALREPAARETKASSAKSALTQDEYDAGLAQHTDAEIAKHYDLSKVVRKTK